MKTKRIRPLLLSLPVLPRGRSSALCGLAIATLTFPSIGWSDVSGTPTLAVNQFLNLDTGATGTSGDIQWTGSQISVNSAASWSPVIAGNYDSLTQATLAQLQYVGGGLAPIPSLLLSSNSIIAFKTRGGNYAKMQVTSIAVGGSLAIRFTTFGASGGGGGGGGTGGPTISAVQNNYGLIPQGLPNYGIAPSTLFFVQGSGLANVTTTLQSSAAPGLQTTLNGVTVTVTVGSTTLQCPLYYLSPTQIDAILPGNTPLGNGTITVNNNGSASQPAQITVVQSAFGILSYNGNLAAAYDANNNLITSANSANPDQAIVLWGSGVGYDPNDDDKVFPQKQDNLTNIPMQAYVGGVQATILYRGRSQFPAVDQVVLTIPSGVTPGCYVSVAIVSGNIVSNSVTIPIAASGRNCSDPSLGIDQNLYQTLVGKSSVKTGVVGAIQTTAITASGTQTTSAVFGAFQAVTGFATQVSTNLVSIGSCIVYNSFSVTAGVTTSPLDAGPSIAVTGPSGSLTMSPFSIPGATTTFYAPPNGMVPAGFLPANGGALTFDNGGGGKDVQHFSVTLNYPGAFTWTNAASITSVSRSQGVTVTWSGGAPGTYVNISGVATANILGRNVTVSFSCQAPVSAGQFAVPVPVLLALPAGNGSLAVSDNANGQFFTAPGLDLGIAQANLSTSKSLAYN